MKIFKNRQIILFRYVPLILVLSFFYILSIKLVLLGILFSIYELNKDLISNFVTKQDHNVLSKEVIHDTIYQKKSSIQQVKNKDNKLTLVETVEKYGFIPSIINDEDKSDVA